MILNFNSILQFVKRSMDWLFGRGATHGRSLGRVAALPRRLQARGAANAAAGPQFWHFFAQRRRLVAHRGAGCAGIRSRALGLGGPGYAADQDGPQTQRLRQGAAGARHQVDGGVRRRPTRTPRHQQSCSHLYVRKCGIQDCRVD